MFKQNIINTVYSRLFARENKNMANVEKKSI